MLAPEIDEFRSQFERISVEADALVAPLSDEQFAWQPAPDVWSVSPCLDHLPATASVHEVSLALWSWLDADYHRRPHAALVSVEN